MNGLDRQILLWVNALIGSSAGLFEMALYLCGAAPLVLVVAVMLSLWWSDPEGERSGPPLLPGSVPREADGKFPLTYEIVYGTAFGPEEGQPRRTADGDIATFSVESLLRSRRLG